MALLQTARNTPTLGRRVEMLPQPVEAATSIFVGGLIALDASGFAVPCQVFGGSPLDVLTVVGLCGGLYLGFPGENPLNVSSLFIPSSQLVRGAAGAVKTHVWRGVFLLNINSTDITQADVGKKCYATDDHTVSDNDDSSARPLVGTIMGLEGGQVWVDVANKAGA